MRLFVAGATGAIGKLLVARLVAARHVGFSARAGAAVTRGEIPLDPSPAWEMRGGPAAIRHLEEAAPGGRRPERIVLRHGGLYGPGTSIAPGREQLALVRRRSFPLVGHGGGAWSSA